MTTKAKIAIGLGVVVVIFLAGYFTHAYRSSARIAGYEKREQERMAQIAANDAQQNQLRGENNGLREHIAQLSASEEALKAIVKERGGAIAAEGQKLEQINEQLKNDQAVVSAPADRCVRCRRFSATALGAKLIDRPLPCTEECSGANQ